MNDRHLAAVGKLRQTVEHKELLPVGDLGQTGGKAAQLALFVLGLHRLLLPLPVDAERRVGDDVLEGVAGELILGQGVTEAHVVGIATPDHHVRLGNGEGGGVELLPEAGDADLRVQLMDALLHAGEHLAGAHGHVVHGDVAAAAQIRVAQQKVGHEIHHVPAGEVGSRFLAEGLGKAAHQILEDIAAVHRRDPIRPQVTLGGIELTDHQVQGVALHHAADDGVEVELGKHVLDVGREARQIVPEVCLDVLRVGEQGVKGELADVVKLIAACLGEKAVLHGEVFDLFVFRQHRVMRGQQAVMKALDHRHRQDHEAVLVRLEWPAQHIRHVPDHRGLLSNVGSDYSKFIVRHGVYLFLSDATINECFQRTSHHRLADR